MKTSFLILGAVSLVSFSGCAYRDATMWSTDVSKVFNTKVPDMQACYDQVLKTDAKAAGKVSIVFEVETEAGKIQSVTVEKGNTTAPDSVQECVTKNLANLSVQPPDRRVGQGKWTFEFAPKS